MPNSSRIPCVAGPYTGVHYKLTLLSSATRVEPTLLDVEECCPGQCTCGCCEQQRYEAITDDPRIVKRYGATEAIATSTGQNDTGLFELNFRDERYLPFEYAGAVSRWRIELPIETNAFDIDTLSDLIFQLELHCSRRRIVTERSELGSGILHAAGRRTTLLRRATGLFGRVATVQGSWAGCRRAGLHTRARIAHKPQHVPVPAGPAACSHATSGALVRDPSVSRRTEL